MKKPRLTQGMIVILLVAVICAKTTTAEANIMYTWMTPIDNETSGQMEFNDTAWYDDILSIEEIDSFFFNGLSQDFTINDIDTFTASNSGFVLYLSTDIYDDNSMSSITMHGPGQITMDEWNVDVSETIPDQDQMQDYIEYVGVWVTATDPHHVSVPEPSTIALLSLGIVGLIGGGARRRLKKKTVPKK